MEGEDPIFDPTKKKKKKKKMPVELEAALTGEAPEDPTPAAPAPTQPAETNDTADSTPAEVSLDDDFGMLKKKKKKKKTAAFDLSELDDNLPTEDKDADGDRSSPTPAPVDFGDDDMDFTLPSKKKKKKKTAIIASDIDKPQGEDTTDSVPGDGGWGTSVAPADATRDYTYEELLKRVFDIMREKNPEMVAGEKKRFVMKPPQMMRVGTKKSSFSNFADICKLLHRQPKHLLAFLLAELGTSGSIDGNNQLIIKGRFQQKQIEHVLRAYIKEYVTCHTCRSPETILQKDTRLHFLQCETCGSRCSVASIKSGFQAVTGKRAALRAKTA